MSSLKEIFGEVKPKNDMSSSQMYIIFGAGGSGKTTLSTTCSELGETILVNFENRVSHIEETDYLRIVPRSKGDFRQDKRMTYEGFKSFVTFLEKNYTPKFVIIDTLDEMFVAFQNGMLQNGEITDKYYGRPEIYQRMLDCLKRIKDTGANLICNCQSTMLEQFGTIDTAIVEKLMIKINQIVDNKFYLNVTDDDNRVLCLKPNNKIKGKLSVQKDIYNKVPNEILNPTWKDIVEACQMK